MTPMATDNWVNTAWDHSLLPDGSKTLPTNADLNSKATMWLFILCCSFDNKYAMYMYGYIKQLAVQIIPIPFHNVFFLYSTVSVQRKFLSFKTHTTLKVEI